MQSHLQRLEFEEHLPQGAEMIIQVSGAIAMHNGCTFGHAASATLTGYSIQASTCNLLRGLGQYICMNLSVLLLMLSVCFVTAAASSEY